MLLPATNSLFVFSDEPDESPLPPGFPPTYKYEGPWFWTQLNISLALGIGSFLIFSYLRIRWQVFYAPRTKLKGFSPHEAHAHQAFFGWILPTIRTSEYTILQIVGLDAAVLLNFFKMAFYLFSCMSVLSITILMPVNLKNNIGEADDGDGWFAEPAEPSPTTPRQRDWLSLLNDANSYLTLHLCFTYLFTILALRFLHKNYVRFIRARQLYSLELVHSIAARTVMVSNLPNHLRGERSLAVYFENMGLHVESVSVSREVKSLKAVINQRTRALLELEQYWVKYLGNPINLQVPNGLDGPPLIDIEAAPTETRLVVPNRKRPSLRVSWFKPKVDALEYLEAKFKEADEEVQKKRRLGKFKAAHTAFVTFEKMSSAQIASQAAHAAKYSECITQLAPEPRDIVWPNMSRSLAKSRMREYSVLGIMVLLLLFWVIPVAALASLLSYQEIKKTMPWLAEIIDSNEQIRAIVQNSLPSAAMITLNAILPFLLEALTYFQGLRARSWIEYSLLKKYFLFLLFNVVFIFLLASTYWQLIRDLAESPMKVPEKLATALQKGQARHFFLSYVILQGFGIMPMQLLNLGVVIPQIIYRAFITRTPRDFAELNAPPMINYGTVYPQAILIFVVTLLYSIIQPIILVFGAAYFGLGYVVYKYKLLFVFYKPYESQGQAWPITFVRLTWGILIFQVFMTGIFLLNKGIVLASLMVPLIIGTVIWCWYSDKCFQPLSKYVNLSSVCEVQRGEESDDVLRLKAGHPVTRSQSNLSRRRYAQNDETLYVAPEDERTDYSQPPMANWYYGVLNTGKRRYGDPALTGVLPQPWLPLKKGQSLVNAGKQGKARAKQDEAVVLTLRKRYSISGRPRAKLNAEQMQMTPTSEQPEQIGSPVTDILADPWRDHTSQGQSSSDSNHLRRRLSFDNATGVITLPEDGEWLMEDADSDSEEDYGSIDHTASDTLVATHVDTQAGEASTSTAGKQPQPPRAHRGTYYHHPEKRRQTIPGAFPS